MSITVHDLAVHRGLTSTTDEPDRFSGADYIKVGLPIMGGCEGCGATIAAYNAYPSKTGFLRCADCVDPYGYDTVEEANRDIFDEEE